MAMYEGGELAFDWDLLLPFIHPRKIEAIEALRWVGEPLSASEIAKLIDVDRVTLSHFSYHLVKLAEAGALKVVRTRQVRGATEKFYFFR